MSHYPQGPGPGGFWSDPKKQAAIVGAGIATLLGVPFLWEVIAYEIWLLVQRQYPSTADLVYFIVQGGFYFLAFAILQASIYAALIAATLSAARFMAFTT